jgi:hypothetical protein
LFGVHGARLGYLELVAFVALVALEVLVTLK